MTVRYWEVYIMENKHMIRKEAGGCCSQVLKMKRSGGWQAEGWTQSGGWRDKTKDRDRETQRKGHNKEKRRPRMRQNHWDIMLNLKSVEKHAFVEKRCVQCHSNDAFKKTVKTRPEVKQVVKCTDPTWSTYLYQSTGSKHRTDDRCSGYKFLCL